MSVELISVLIAVLAIGVAQSGLILTSNRGLREDMARMEARLREDMKQLAERVARVEHSQAKLEGLLEGLREAITGRVKAWIATTSATSPRGTNPYRLRGIAKFPMYHAGGGPVRAASPAEDPAGQEVRAKLTLWQ